MKTNITKITFYQNNNINKKATGEFWNYKQLINNNNITVTLSANNNKKQTSQLMTVQDQTYFCGFSFNLGSKLNVQCFKKETKACTLI